jgi:adenylate kinase
MNAQNKNDRAAWLQGPSAKCSTLPKRGDSVLAIRIAGCARRRERDASASPEPTIGRLSFVYRRCVPRRRKPNGCEQMPAMAAALEYTRRGDLVPDSTVWEMVHERSGCLHCQGGFVLDGFPRTVAQAEALSQLMQDENLALSAVVNYELPVAEIVSRLSGRRICEKCRAVFHETRQPSRAEGVCDQCGGRLYQREDDRPESVKLRLEVYENSTAPLIKFYRELGLLVPVTATGSPEEICAHTLSALEHL